MLLMDVGLADWVVSMCWAVLLVYSHSSDLQMENVSSVNLSSIRQHLSYGGCLGDKREDGQNCSNCAWLCAH